MFILVNCSDDFGLDVAGRFDTKKEAFRNIAERVDSDFGYSIDMSEYPFENDPIGCYYSENNLAVMWGSDFCSCTYYDKYGAYNEKWLIIEA